MNQLKALQFVIIVNLILGTLKRIAYLMPQAILITTLANEVFTTTAYTILVALVIWGLVQKQKWALYMANIILVISLVSTTIYLMLAIINGKLFLFLAIFSTIEVIISAFGLFAWNQVRKDLSIYQ